MIRVPTGGRMVAMLAFCGLTVLAGCSGNEDPGPFCPVGAIIYGLDEIEDHAFGPQSIDTLRYSVSLTNIDGRCTYAGNRLSLNYTIDVTAQRGPALQLTDIAVPYFVTVLDENDQVISKDLFNSSFTLTEDQPTMRHRDRFEQIIEGVDPDSGRFYSVYFGFQSDPEEALQRRLVN